MTESRCWAPYNFVFEWDSSTCALRVPCPYAQYDEISTKEIDPEPGSGIRFFLTFEMSDASAIKSEPEVSVNNMEPMSRLELLTYALRKRTKEKGERVIGCYCVS